MYVLATRNDFDGATLAEAIRVTFDHRKTKLADIVAFEPGFSEDPLRQVRWKSFLKKKQAMIDVPFDEMIRMIRAFLTPIIECINSAGSFTAFWHHEKQEWE